MALQFRFYAGRLPLFLYPYNQKYGKFLCFPVYCFGFRMNGFVINNAYPACSEVFGYKIPVNPVMRSNIGIMKTAVFKVKVGKTDEPAL